MLAISSVWLGKKDECPFDHPLMTSGAIESVKREVNLDDDKG